MNKYTVMVKSETSLCKLNLLLSVTLSIIILSCNGQINKGDSKALIAAEKVVSRDSTLKNYPIKEQISQVIRTVFQDSKGNIWFGTQNGAFKLSGESLIHVDGVKSESGGNVTIKDITEDKDGKIWFGHTDGISSIDGDTYTNYYESDGLLSNDVWCIAADSKGNIWVGTIAGVCFYNGQKFTSFDLPEGKIDSTLGISSTKMVHDIRADRNGTLWFSSNSGLFSYANNLLTDVGNQTGIKTNFVNKIFEDRKGALWISTKVGLYHLKDDKLTDITEGKIEIGKGIGSVAEDKDGTTWFVANQHHLYTYNGKEIIEYQKTPDNKGPVVFEIYRDRSDRLWFVGYGGAFRLENDKFLKITKNGPW